MAERQGKAMIRRASPAMGPPELLDAVSCDDGLTRLFLRTRSPAPTTPDLIEWREISGGGMAILPGDATPALAGGIARPTSAETATFAGRNCLLASRLAETPEQVAEWLAYHALHHGAQGAVIVNRAEPDGPSGPPAAFARRLRLALAQTGLPLRIIVHEPGQPLGKPDLGPETHPFLAPDAPGKDRMEAPPPDPWLSPLGEGAVIEALKWRYLARARAVLLLDVCDLLPPRPAGHVTAFDLCTTAQGGVVLLVGRRIYPWRLRAGREARIGDHICLPFDARRGIARWGVAPAVAGLDKTWRLVRVAYARPDPGLVIPFWRAMALRVPGRSPSELVPKTSLVESDTLLALAATLDHQPVRAPVSQTRSPAQADQVTIVTTMKNEGPFILEWLAYHRAIGVTGFLVYTNDCSDGTDGLLELLQRKGLVQHRDNPYRSLDMKPQHAALQVAEAEPLIRDCTWAICMDVDEFLTIKIGDGRLPALFAAMEAAAPGANMISATWRLFGNAEVHGYDDLFVIEQFTRCAPELVRKPHQAWGFKTLFRNIDLYRKLGVHRPKGLRPDLWDQVIWLNGSGRRMPREMFRNGWRSSLTTYGYDWVSLNHYAVRSAESFLVKRDRGRVNHVDRDQGLNYWFRMNFNAETDHAIGRMIPAARAEFNRLMADPEIAAAHEAAVAWHRAKIAELKARPDQAAFYAALTSERMERLCRLQAHFGSAVFGAGPEAIPADLPLDDLPKDFFFTLRPSPDGEQAEADHDDKGAE